MLKRQVRVQVVVQKERIRNTRVKGEENVE